MFLPNLHSLVLNSVEHVENSTDVFSTILRLPKLKYFKITYRIKTNQDQLRFDFTQQYEHSIEMLIINSDLESNQLKYIFSLQNLRHLYIKSVIYSSEDEFFDMKLNNIKFISLKLYLRFINFEKYLRNFFINVEVLRLTTTYDKAYLDAKRWQNLIESYMPNLRIFDLFHIGSLVDVGSTCHSLTDFQSSFWIDKKFFSIINIIRLLVQLEFFIQINLIGKKNEVSALRQ